MKKYIVLLLTISISFATAQEKTRFEREIHNYIDKITPELIEIRRKIHQNPELGNREFKTAALAAEKLRSLGISVQEKVAHTGVVGILRGKNAGRTAAVRGDMDALPIQEMTDLPFKSRNDGVMHACGHDVHTTVVIGTAMVLSEFKDRFNGTVKFIFQPAEEGPPRGERGGASLMIEEKVLENPAPEVIFGLHVSPEQDVGYLGYTPGGALASSDGFQITIKGKGTHAAYPWLGIDPIVTASQVVIALQNIRSRMTDTRQPLVISVGMIQGGNRSNIIPEQVRLVGTIRTHDQELRMNVRKLMEQVVSGICASTGAEYTLNVGTGAPVTFNNVKLTDWSVAIFKRMFGAEKVVKVPPAMGAEDFAYYGREIPAFFYFLGVKNEEKGFVLPLHNPYFGCDEDAIPLGIESMVNLVLKFLDSREEFTR